MQSDQSPVPNIQQDNSTSSPSVQTESPPIVASTQPPVDPVAIPVPTAVNPAPSSTAVSTDPVVDDIVAQAGAIQDLFKKNDELAESTSANAPTNELAAALNQTVSPQQPSTSPSTSTAADQVSTPDNFSFDEDKELSAPIQPAIPTENTTAAVPPSAQVGAQKSPLDILEEILNKEQKKQEVAVTQEEGPSPEAIALKQQLEAENQLKLEEARRQMLEETGSEEQKKRDAIRQEQMSANQVNNPYEIKQLQHKKIMK